MITKLFSLDFVSSLVGPVASGWTLGLLAAQVDSLSADSVYADLTLLSDPPNSGYAGLSLPSWTWSPTSPDEVVAGVGAYFENTGTTAWQPVYGYYVSYRNQASDPVLAWFTAFNAPIELAAGDRITFPDGVTFRLRNKR